MDLVIGVLGLDPEPSPPESDLARVKTNACGVVVVNENPMTSVPGVSACDDSVRGPSLVVHAAREARKAVAGIQRYLAECSM